MGLKYCRLKRDEQTRLIPVIFITALNDRRHLDSRGEAGGRPHQTRFDRLELTARVAKSLVVQKRLNGGLRPCRNKFAFSIATGRLKS